MSTQAENAKAKAIERMRILKVCRRMLTSLNPAVKRLADDSEAINRICKRLRSNDEVINRMCSSGALKHPHPEVKRLSGNDPTPLLFVWYPYIGPPSGAGLVMEEEL